MRKTTLTAIGLALGIAGPASAAEEIGLDEWLGYEANFTQADANGDGMVDQQEFDQWANDVFGGAPGGGDADGPLFGLLDINDDQQLTQDEFFTEGQFDVLDDNDSAYLEDDEFRAGPQEQAAVLDANEDAQVSQAEWTEYGGQSFEQIDADGSGTIEEAEYNQWASTNWGGAPGGGDDDGPLFGLLDVNDDVQVDQDEWFSDDAFSALDDDDSGVLEDDEWGV